MIDLIIDRYSEYNALFRVMTWCIHAKAISWTKSDHVLWRYMASLIVNELFLWMIFENIKCINNFWGRIYIVIRMTLWSAATLQVQYMWVREVFIKTLILVCSVQ